jgi:photosystem II stability/assembly factor-like uncharacterized protein
VRTSILGLTAAAVALLATLPALANGRFPASNQIIFSPTHENTIIGRATYAILPSTDNGKSWGYLCEDALALPGSKSFQDPEIGVTSNNSIIAGLYAPTMGLDVSNDLGCNWNCIGGPLAGQQIADIVVRPDLGPDAGSTSHQVLALTSTFVDAGVASQVFESPDDGVTWTALSPPLDPTVAFATIDVAPSDPSRIYLSGNRNYALARTGSLFASADNGKTWTEYPVPTFNALIACSDMPSMKCQSEDSLYIAGVDPTDENRVYLRSDGPTNTGTPGNSILYVTTDGGKTFQIAKSFALPQPNSDFLVSGELLGFALSADGSKVYVGTKETGLFSAPKTDVTTFTQINSKVQVQCLADRVVKSTGQEELWACSNEVGGFIFGKSTDNGVSFTSMMPTITSMSGLIACSPTGGSAACLTDANASACSCSDYQQFCSVTEAPNACLGCGQDGGGPPPSADDAGDAGGPGGVTDGGAEGGAGKSAASPNASCGCSVVGGGSAAGFFAGWAILAIAVRRRRAR